MSSFESRIGTCSLTNSLADCLLHWQFWTDWINTSAATEHPLHEKPRTSRHQCPEGIFPLPPSAFCAFLNQRMIIMIKITTELVPYGMGSRAYACWYGFFLRELMPFGMGLDQRSLCLLAWGTSI